MRILMAGDTHGDLSHCEYLVRNALTETCDRIFVLGDFGYWEHQESGVKFLDQLEEYAGERGVDVYFLDGNHDKTSLLTEKYTDKDGEGFIIVRPHVKYAWRGHRWTWDSTRFISLGGAYSVDKDWRLDKEERFPGRYPPESLWFPEEEMSDEDMDVILEDDSHANIILAHDKPRSSNPKWNRKDFLECLPNQDRLQRACRVLRPQLFLHGHLHYFYTDEMWYGAGLMREVQVTKVIGLLCNPDAGEPGLYVNKKLSWLVLDTEDVLGAGRMVRR
jgi:hypothetical protein